MSNPRKPGLSFRGYVALADAVFGLAAGFLLLNPLKPDPKPMPPGHYSQGAEIAQQEKDLTRLLDKIEAQQDDIRGSLVEYSMK